MALKRDWFLIIAMLVAALLGFSLGSALMGKTGAVAEAPTPLPEPTDWPLPTPDAIFTGAAAVERSLQQLPAGVAPDAEVVRLLVHNTFFGDWLAQPDVPSYWNESSGVWLVGLRDVATTAGDVAAGAHVDDTVPNPVDLDGYWFAWDANSGEMAGMGGLTPDGGSGHTLSRIAAYRDAQVPVTPESPPTPLPDDGETD